MSNITVLNALYEFMVNMREIQIILRNVYTADIQYILIIKVIQTSILMYAINALINTPFKQKYSNKYSMS